jgi:acyl carrier protein
MAGQAAAARARRGGIAAMTPQLAVAALSLILAQDEATSVVADVDWARFAPGFTASRPSLLLTGVAEARQAIETANAQPTGRERLPAQLAGLPDAGQEQLILELVCQEAAAILGHATVGAVRPGAVFRDLGFDSLTAVEFRNRLAVVTGLQLPATLVFDYPTPQVLARWLRAVISPATGESADSGAEEAEIRRALASISLARLRGAGFIGPLLRLAAFQAEESVSDEGNETNVIDTMDAESLIRMAHGNAEI